MAKTTEEIRTVISQMTLEEKAGLCSGKGFWYTKAVERLGIPHIMMSDGPHGLRRQANPEKYLPGEPSTVQAICFPTSATLACSWDKDLAYYVGQTLAEECIAEQVSVILGPGINIKRSPLCGRNFEYFSEDPYLAGQMAKNQINGIQEKGIGTSLKHFAVNNQENNRFAIDTIVDERTLREIYLAGFETAVKGAQPWTVMAAYNKFNGDQCSENQKLLTDILRDEWGFEGMVVSDWGAVNDRVKGLKAGLDLEMPQKTDDRDMQIVHAVQEGRLEEAVLDRAVERILRVIFRGLDRLDKNAAYDKDAHHDIARKVAQECMVLLKNEGHILPLKKSGRIAVIGDFAQNPRYQGGGSSHINPTRVDNIFDELRKQVGTAVDFTYAQGYRTDADAPDEALLQEAVANARNADVAVIFAGLPESFESEGYDRQHMRMPNCHNQLIEAVAAVQKNTVVVLSNGSPVEMPWIDQVPGLLEAYLGGQALGGAIAAILFGDVNPSGKLAETFPEKLCHNPSYLNFPGFAPRVEYKEGVFVGYRYYDKVDRKPLFPFGYGLSYTSFAYTKLEIDKKEMQDTDTLTVRITVKNTGDCAGKEIVQLYVGDPHSHVIRPEKELKGFEKLELAPGEEKTAEFKLDKRSFAYYNTEIHDWYVESGVFEIMAGASSRDIRLKDTVTVHSTTVIRPVYSRNTPIYTILEDPEARPIAEAFLQEKGLDVKKDFNMEKDSPMRMGVSFASGKLTDALINELLERLEARGSF